MDPMAEDQTEVATPADPRRAVVFIVTLVLIAAATTIFLTQWIPLWVTLPASLAVAMMATRLDARVRAGKD